jgi:hypothetical protein
MSADDIPLDRMQRALVTMAYIVIRHGPAYAPILDRLERELVERQSSESPLARAQRLLEAHTLDGGRKAILSNHSRF